MIKDRMGMAEKEQEAWERWAREVCQDFRIGFDNHPVGLRTAIVCWMADHN
jgi:hypothetical protein